MKILLINTFDRGGAGIACIRLHQGLLENGVDSTLLTMTKSRNDLANHYSYEELVPSKRKSLLGRIFKKVKSKLVKPDRKYLQLKASACKTAEYFSLIHSSYRIDLIPGIEKYDVINLHWVADFLDWSTFFTSSKIKNVSWTLHDMHPFTGGYHYSGGYEGYKKNDENPPFIKGTYDPKFCSKQLNTKVDILDRSNVHLHIVGLSNWLFNCSKSSTVFKEKDHHLIPNGIDNRIFKPISKEVARTILNLPQDKKIILFVSDSLQNKRKGFHFLLEAIQQMDQDNFVVCGVGRKSKEIAESNVRHLGAINDERLMSVIYNAADVFVLPSVEDNLPNVIVEALLCGLPSIGFKIGGMTDLIQESENGLLCDEISADTLLKQINAFFEEGITLSKNEIAENASLKYSYNVQAKGYMKLFEEILAK